MSNADPFSATQPNESVIPLRTRRIERDFSTLRQAPRGWLPAHERGVPIQTTPGEMWGGAVYGIAIHSRSETRAVRVYSGEGVPSAHDASAWTDVIEGAPVPVYWPAHLPLWIEALDMHDGAVELQAAMVPAAFQSLCIDYAPHSEIIFGQRSTDARGAGYAETVPPGAGETLYARANYVGGVNVYDLAPPRCAVGITRKIECGFVCGAAVGNIELYSVMRDRGGLVVTETLVGSVATAAGPVSIAAVNVGPGRKWGRIKIPGGALVAGRVALL